MASAAMNPERCEDFEIVLNDKDQITGFKNLEVTIAPNLMGKMILYYFDFIYDLIMLEKEIKPSLYNSPHKNIMQESIYNPFFKLPKCASAFVEMEKKFESAREKLLKEVEYLPCIIADVRKFISTIKSLANHLYGIELDLDIDRVLAADTETDAKRECHDYLSKLNETYDLREPDMVYTAHVHLNEKFKRFQNMKFRTENNELIRDSINWINNPRVKFKCDVTLFENGYITRDTFESMCAASDNDILEYINRTFPMYDLLYKLDNQPFMIVQIMIKEGLPHFMCKPNTIGYMGINFVPLVELTQNPIITRTSRNDKNHGIHFDFNGEHDYFAQLYESFPLQYLFEGDTKPLLKT
jgi:hypothetical protein